jgi:hypothetical protein
MQLTADKILRTLHDKGYTTLKYKTLRKIITTIGLTPAVNKRVGPTIIQRARYEFLIKDIISLSKELNMLKEDLDERLSNIEGRLKKIEELWNA